METLSAASADEREKRLQERLLQLARSVFPLDTGPLFKVHLFRLGDNEHVFFLLIHHIVFDGLSASLVMRELSELYGAGVKGEALPPREGADYSDHVMWQREWFASDDAQKQLAFWKEQLSGELPVLELPADKARPPRQSINGDSLYQIVDGKLLEQLQQCAREHNASLFMLLTAALNLLLGRYAGQDDVILGLPVANRRRQETEQVIGYFANTLALRNRLDYGQSFRDFLAQVRRVCLDAFSHEDTPFEQLVEVLQPERDMSRTPIFQAMFSYEEREDMTATLGELPLELVEVDGKVARTDLAIWIYREAGRLRCAWEYCADLFHEDTIARMQAGFRTLLEAIAADPSQQLGRLPVMPDEMRRRVLEEWNATAADYPRETCLPQAIEQTAAHRGDATALICGNTELSYRDLNELANQLAHYLISQGISPGDRIGLCLERSPRMLIALLGIMKSGAAYVPLDPGFPGERLRYMCEDAQIRLLISDSESAGIISDYAGERLLLDEASDALAEQLVENPPAPARPEDLMYVIYTSGSTGKPKGVALPHRAVMNFLAGMAQCPGLDESNRLLAVTTLSFDIAVLELYLPCCRVRWWCWQAAMRRRKARS